MSRNIVPRTNKGADLGTAEKNWNRLYADAVILRNKDLQALLNGKVDLNTLTDKGDLYVATDAGIITRLPAGEDGYVLKANSTAPEGLIWGPAGARQELTGDITINVGIGGDFPTINAALEHVVALYYPKYISGYNCPRVTIYLLPGFIMSEQVLVESLDLSWITITGHDTETIINQSALTIYFGSKYPAFGAMNGGFLPIIGQLFNIDTSGDPRETHGIYAENNSRAIILPDCGVKNASLHGIHASDSSTINANGADASGAGTHGIFAAHGSTINAEGADASGADIYGIFAARSSTINAEGANASGAGIHGICAAHGSTINAEGANASGAGDCGICATRGSTINAEGANASGADTYGIYAAHGSLINANGATGTLSQAKNTLTANGIIFQE